VWYYKDNGERLLEQDSPVRSCDTASLFPDRIDRMTTLCAKGKSALDDVTPMYLWSYGNYKYEIEAKPNSHFSNCEVFESSYEDALSKFESMAMNVEVTPIL